MNDNDSCNSPENLSANFPVNSPAKLSVNYSVNMPEKISANISRSYTTKYALMSANFPDNFAKNSISEFTRTSPITSL